mgnify:CR=1 FL=1
MDLMLCKPLFHLRLDFGRGLIGLAEFKRRQFKLLTLTGDLLVDRVNVRLEFGHGVCAVIDNAEQPSQAAEFGLDPDNVMEYDFEDATANIKTYVEEVMNALGGGDDRFKTE